MKGSRSDWQYHCIHIILHTRWMSTLGMWMSPRIVAVCFGIKSMFSTDSELNLCLQANLPLFAFCKSAVCGLDTIHTNPVCSLMVDWVEHIHHLDQQSGHRWTSCRRMSRDSGKCSQQHLYEWQQRGASAVPHRTFAWEHFSAIVKQLCALH